MFCCFLRIAAEKAHRILAEAMFSSLISEISKKPSGFQFIISVRSITYCSTHVPVFLTPPSGYFLYKNREPTYWMFDVVSLTDQKYYAIYLLDSFQFLFETNIILSSQLPSNRSMYISTPKIFTFLYVIFK